MTFSVNKSAVEQQMYTFEVKDDVCSLLRTAIRVYSVVAFLQRLA